MIIPAASYRQIRNSEKQIDWRESEILALIKKDPPEALRLLIDQYTGLVKVVVRRILPGHPREDLEECCAETFVRFWRTSDRFDPARGTLKQILAAIARNTAIDRLRQKGEETLPLDEEQLGVEPDLVDGFSRRINARLLNETISDLPQPDREIFIRRYYFCERVANIARHLGLDEKMVENKLFRGRQKLKKALIEKGVIL